MNLSKFLLLLFPILLLTACNQSPCSNKEAFIENFEAFVKEFEDKVKDLNEASKQEYEEKYEDFVNDCYKKFNEELTLEERQDFWKTSLGFYLELYKGNIGELLEDADTDPFKSYVKDEIEKLIKESGTDYLAEVSVLLEDELPKLLESFLGDLEKIGMELLEIFQN